MFKLDVIIKAAMAEHSLSLRKLSELCGISPSTVSRILNNKQPATIGHLQAFSTHLGIPLANLLKASGVEIDENMNGDSKIILSMIYDILKSYEINLDDIIPEIHKELRKNEQYTKTAAGKEVIESSFGLKMSSLNGEGIIIEKLNSLHELYCSEETPLNIQSIAGSVLLYLIQTPDVIPDYAFPIGYFDDAIAVTLTAKRLLEEFNISV